MAKRTIFSGELNQKIDLYSKTVVRNSFGENKKIDFLVASKWVKRIDTSGNEDEDGRLIPVRDVRYYMRYDENVLKNGTKFFVKDFDGDYEITSVNIFGNRRKAFLEIKTQKRGE